MRKAILMMLLAVVSGNAVAEWVTVAQNENTTTYADPATIRRSGDMVKMWHLYDFKTPEGFDAHIKPHSSLLEQREYDCKKELRRRLASIYYSENMRKGRVVFFDHDPDKWLPIPPSTTIETLWKIVCEKL